MDKGVKKYLDDLPARVTGLYDVLPADLFLLDAVPCADLDAQRIHCHLGGLTFSLFNNDTALRELLDQPITRHTLLGSPHAALDDLAFGQ